MTALNVERFFRGGIGGAFGQVPESLSLPGAPVVFRQHSGSISLEFFDSDGKPIPPGVWAAAKIPRS